jgi:hypothetical protein
MEKKFLSQAALSLILNVSILAKIKNAPIAKTSFNSTIEKYKDLEPDFERLPEIRILREFLVALETDNEKLINTCIDVLIEKLVFFEHEISFLELLRTEEQKTPPIEDKLSREEVGKKRKLEILEAQKYSKIQQKMGDVRREKPEFLRQRNAMKKRYYKDVILLLEAKLFKEAALEYLRLAQSLAKRRDLRTSSLMVLLHGLALIKAGEPIQTIRSHILTHLGSLGLNKKLVEDTYYILCIDFILDVISYKMDNYLPKLKDLLEILPLFDEEKQLIEISI